MESPARKVKHASASVSALAQLPSLLAELEGKVLDLTVRAAIAAPAPPGGGDRRDEDAPTAADNHPHVKICRDIILELFAEHVGTSPETMLVNAVRVATDERDREQEIFDYGYGESEDDGWKWLNHPQHTDIEGPKADGRVWLAMLLGEGRAEEALRGTVRINAVETGDAASESSESTVVRAAETGDTASVSSESTSMSAVVRLLKIQVSAPEQRPESSESVVVRLLENDASELSPLELLANVLSYVREEARRGARPVDILRFSVVYGLDGVMSDVLQGKYGPAEDLDINTLLPLSDDDEAYMFFVRKMFMPAYAIAAILGHENVVVAALTRLGGAPDVPCGMQKREGAEVEEYRGPMLPSHVLLWVIMKNMPDMLKCLVNDCGFQFRWIDHDLHLHMVHRRIFDAAEDESFPKWTDIDRQEVMWTEGEQARCRLRAGAAYKKQMKMLDVLASLGFPLSLFFDTGKLDDLIDQEEALIKEKKLETRDQCKAYMRGLGTDARRARERLYKACCIHNSMQGFHSNEEGEGEEDEAWELLCTWERWLGSAREDKTLMLGDYYRELKSRWDSQESVQADRLPEFEALDSRWRKTLRKDDEEREDEYVGVLGMRVGGVDGGGGLI